MARTNASMFAFNRGEVSKAALARVDNERLRLAAECQLNWLPTVIGEMTLRPGLEFINSVQGNNPCAMVPFIFAKDDTAIIELTDSTLCVEVYDELIMRVAVATTISDPTFLGGGTWSTAGSSAGTTATIGGGLLTLASPVGGIAQATQTISVAPADLTKEHAIRFVVVDGPVTVRAGSLAGNTNYIAQTTLDTGTHSLAFTPTTTSVFLQIESYDAWAKTLSSVSIEGAGLMTLPTPWNAAALPTVRYDQSGDIIYLGAYGVSQQRIERRSTRSWSIVLHKSDAGPFNTFFDATINMSPTVYSGNGLLNASVPYFQPGHVGALFQLFSPGQNNQAVLGGQSAFSEPVRVTGVGATRNYSWTVGSGFVGTVTFQRSFDGPDSGYSDVSSVTSAGTIASTTGGSSSTPDLDNVIAWERVGFKASAYTSGSVTVSSNYDGGGGFGLCRCTGYVSPTQIAIEVLTPFSSIAATNNWLEGDWSSFRGYPTSVGFFEGRLAWSGGLSLWMSQPDDFTGYATQDDQGNDLGDAAAIIETFGSGPADRVNWLLPLTRLLCGREQTIESVRSSSFDEVVTPSNISTKACATRGAARAKAVKLDKSGIFIDESFTRIYKVSFSAQLMDYSAEDLTRLNTDIGEPGFLFDNAIQRQRDTHIWFPKNDGQVAVLLEDEPDEISCFWRLQTLGIVENVLVLPAPSGPENYLYVVVRRVINGQTVRFREKLAPRLNCIGGTINQLFDSHLVYSGVAVSSVQLPWLPNTLVGVWADGAYLGTATSDGSGNVATPDGQTHSNIVAGLLGGVYVAEATAPNFDPVSSVAVPAAYNGFPAEVFADNQRVGVLIVTGGALTLPAGRTAGSITAFVGYVAPFMSAKLAYAAQGGTAINQSKKIDAVGLLLLNTAQAGLMMGQRFDQLEGMPEVEDGQVVAAGTIYGQYDEHMQNVSGTWDSDARLCLLAQAPLPATVNGLVVAVTTNG